MLLLKTGYRAKINEIEGKIPSITGLATTAALNIVENKIRIQTQHQDSSHEDRLQKYLSLRLTIWQPDNILPHMIIINLPAKYLMQRWKKKRIATNSELKAEENKIEKH